MRRRDLFRMGGLAALGAATAACGAGGGAERAGRASLQFMYWGSAFEQKAVATMLREFERRKPGVKVSALFTPDEYDVKLNTLVAGNRMPDVGYVPMAMSFRLGEQGKLLNLFPYLTKYPQLAGYLPDAYLWSGQDRLHGVATANEIELLWYSRSAIAEAGAETPPALAASAWTWDRLVENARKLTVDQDGRHPDESGFDPRRIRRFGISCSLTYPPAWYGFLRSNGGDFADEAGRRCLLDSPEAIEVFQNLQDLIYEHRVSPGPGQLAATGDDVPGTSILLKTRRVAMVVDGHWSLLDMNESKVDYGIGVLPVYERPYTTAQVAGGLGGVRRHEARGGGGRAVRLPHRPPPRRPVRARPVDAPGAQVLRGPGRHRLLDQERLPPAGVPHRGRRLRARPRRTGLRQPDQGHDRHRLRRAHPGPAGDRERKAPGRGDPEGGRAEDHGHAARPAPQPGVVRCPPSPAGASRTTVSPAGVSSAGVSSAGVSPIGVSRAGVSPASGAWSGAGAC
ncbi:extracellular solute-binding protein [Streptosporangium longisporum]|uniref:extracellular solute-binding protein n=1 Tax=Streptosporangium longisporum TaxID=46187 RepID=UPI0031E7E1FF